MVEIDEVDMVSASASSVGLNLDERELKLRSVPASVRKPPLVWPCLWLEAAALGRPGVL